MRSAVRIRSSAASNQLGHRPNARDGRSPQHLSGTSRLGTSSSLTTGATPAQRCRAVGTPEGPHEVAWIPIADSSAYLLHRQVGLDQETPRLCHAPLDRGQVASRQAHCLRHVPERDGFVIAILYVAEDLCKQGFVLEP